MGISHGKALYFTIDEQGGANPRNISGDIKSITGLPGSVDMDDITGGGATGHSYNPGLQKARFVAVMVVNTTATTGSWTVLSNFQTDTTTRSFVCGPSGASSGPKLSGECRIVSIDLPVDPTKTNLMTVTFELDGAISIGSMP